MKLNFLKIIIYFLRSLDKRFKVMLIAIGLYSWASNLTSKYNQLYITALGANPLELGSLNSVGGIVNSIISAPIGSFVDRYGVKKAIIMGLILSAIVSTIYSCATNWLMIIPAIILTQVSFRMIIPLTDIIFIETSRPKSRAQAMGLSRTVWAIPSILAPMIAAIIVSTFGGINDKGIRPLYVLQLISTLLIISLIIFMLEEPHIQHNVINKSRRITIIRDFRELFKGEKWLREWIIIMSLWRFGASIAMPFIPLWMVNVKGADPYILGIMSTAGLITSALLQIPMGTLADKIGRKKIFFLLRPFSYLGTLFLVFAPDPKLLILVGILGALGLMDGLASVSFIPFITMYWETVPAEKRGRWFGFTGILNVLTVPASIIGGLLWQIGLKEFVLLLPVLIEVLGIVPLLIRIPDTLDLGMK